MEQLIKKIRSNFKPDDKGIIPRDQIRDAVKQILAAAKMDNRPDTVGLAKWLGFSVFDSSLSHLGEDVIGLMYDGEDPYPGVNETRFIALEENDSPARKRSTIAHEIGHYTLEERPANQNYIYSERRITSDKNDSKEQNASRFMYELLLPHDLLKKFLDSRQKMEWRKILNEASSYFDVSFGLIKRHIETVSGKPVLEQGIYQGGYLD